MSRCHPTSRCQAFSFFPICPCVSDHGLQTHMQAPIEHAPCGGAPLIADEDERQERDARDGANDVGVAADGRRQLLNVLQHALGRVVPSATLVPWTAGVVRETEEALDPSSAMPLEARIQHTQKAGVELV